MTKISLELEDIKALASDSRLELLKALDGKKLTLQELTRSMSLNKATLHVHLSKLLQAGFIKKKERSGHKWVYYSLTWKGESLLHPENTKIVLLFSFAFFSFCAGIIQLINYARGTIVGFAQTLPSDSITRLYAISDETKSSSGVSQRVFQNIANVPAKDQTLMQLSQALNSNSTIQGLANNYFSDDALRWSVTSKSIDYLSQETGAELGTDAEQLLTPHASNVVAYVQDPTVLYLGVILLVIFGILVSIAIWRLWITRVQKL